MDYDVIVIGGGHAGCEASYAAARLNVKTALITTKIDTIAMTPCNPSIGGPAKGIVVREIDALGGLMGRVADMSSLQIKMLNLSKGPAVHSLRAQVDKIDYPKNMQNILRNTKNLDLFEDQVDELIYDEDNNSIVGVLLASGRKINSKTTIITTGTYMDSYIIKGDEKVASGPENLASSSKLSKSIEKLGLDLFRLKTGTPARVLTDTIDFSKAEVTSGDFSKLAFSFYKPTYIKDEDQIPCHLIYTTPKTHEIINKNLSKSAMYSGVIEGVGPRYCPSIEDKLVRFADKERHQLFLEPESRHLNTTYVQGFSTSMPNDVQEEMIHSLPGLENAVIDKYGYAIEYDAIRPEQLKLTLECKRISNLYSAGQINGTSGYEEAAGQGIVAGINAALKVLKKEPLILSRMDSYIGLMIDDLITKGTDEPYRLLTSRSEFRLHLRNDNADLRLSPKAIELNLLDDEDVLAFNKKSVEINKLRNQLSSIMLSPKIITDEIAKKLGTEPLKHGVTADVFLKRPNIKLVDLKEILELDFSLDVLEQVEIQIRYEGYITKVQKQIEKSSKLYQIKLPLEINYNELDNIALEAREKLNKIRPETLGHAAQISGINPADIAVLQVYIEQIRRSNEK